jgi:hypothetical protein
MDVGGLPVLHHVAQLLEVEHVGEVNPRLVADSLDVDVDEVLQSLLRLYDAQPLYVDSVDSSSASGVASSSLR